MALSKIGNDTASGGTAVQNADIRNTGKTHAFLEGNKGGTSGNVTIKATIKK